MRITQSATYLKSLLEDVMNARVFPAAMQRPYVWNQKDVEDLCDSIMSGFPIGGFLSWNPLNQADVKDVAFGRLGPIFRTRDINDRYIQLLLDGQNRLASLAWAAFRDQPNEDLQLSTNEAETWAGSKSLVLDLEKGGLLFVPKEEANSPLRVPAWVALNVGDGANSASNTLLRTKWTEWESHGIKEESILAMMTLVDQAQRAFSEAKIAVTLIEGATVDQARSAFLRICRVGVQMSQEDFDRAVSWNTGE